MLNPPPYSKMALEPRPQTPPPQTQPSLSSQGSFPVPVREERQETCGVEAPVFLHLVVLQESSIFATTTCLSQVPTMRHTQGQVVRLELVE